ncbi:nucleoside deaminase [Paenibacillus alkalitolerans]|uniref:nucleoside deaminase n=1 Tax=Paenibacillus alkalitolerans TaxID=2799335 RepID=UPI0018F6FA37|nr:nucleoside deaminase [Paenibacillus alkalitolerans]
MIADQVYLLSAFEEAEKAKSQGTFSIGAVIVNSQGEIVGRGRNKVFSECDTTAHAEVDAIRNASSLMLDLETKRFTRNDLTLYTTCEPCPMCSCSILLSFSITRVVWASNDISMGAMRKFKEEPLFIERFAPIAIEAEPVKELKIRQRKMMAEFYTSRGYTNTEWHQELE